MTNQAPEFRWRCGGCHAYIPGDRVTCDAAGAHHMVGPWIEDSYQCGPVVCVEVDVQELWVEWIEAHYQGAVTP